MNNAAICPIQAVQPAVAPVTREAVADEIRKLGQQSVSVAWILADVRESETYRNWGYDSFLSYLKGDISALMSQSYAYQLSDIGKNFRNWRNEIEQKLGAGELHISDLVHGNRLISEGSSPEVVALMLLSGLRANLPKASGANDPSRYTVYVPKGKEEMFSLGLAIHAINNSLQSKEEALYELAVSALPDEIAELKSKFSTSFLAKYLPLIEQGKYVCRLCGAIPITPTLHHVLPRSLGGGYGPLALLCWQPCHEHVVQPEWRKFARKWLGKDAVKDLTSEAKEYRMKHGKYVDEPDSELWKRVI